MSQPHRIEYEQGPDNWSAHSPDLPGCIATGATREVVEREMRQAIAFHLEGMASEAESRQALRKRKAPARP